MVANIKSKKFAAFNCLVKSDPVLTQENIQVYELVNSSVPNDIIKKVNGQCTGTFRHVALDANKCGYLFDFKNKKTAGKLGLCDYIER